MADILGVGALNLDFIFDVTSLEALRVPGLPLEAGGELVGTDAQRAMLDERLSGTGVLRMVSAGGSAANTCHVLSRMGYRTGLVGALGDDEDGERYLAGLEDTDTSCVVRRGRTGCAYIINAEQGDRSIVVFPGNASDIAPVDLKAEVIAGASWVHMSSYTSRIGMEAQLAVRQLARDARVSVDPGEIYARQGSAALPLIEGIEVLFITDRELAMLSGPGGDDAIAKALGCARVTVVKKGARGAALVTREGLMEVGTEVLQAVDTTGAGDVLDGVFIGLYLDGVPPPSALRTAVRAAGMSIGGYGRDAYPTKQDIERIYEAVLVHDGQG